MNKDRSDLMTFLWTLSALFIDMTDTCQVSQPHPALLPLNAESPLLLFFLLLAGQIRSFPLHLLSIELTFGKLQENGGAILTRGPGVTLSEERAKCCRSTLQ